MTLCTSKIREYIRGDGGIYVHAILYDYGILKSHTEDADCGESAKDWNRFIWDTWSTVPTQRLR